MNLKRKMPTKAELIQLQKIYKTDKKIGERLGGVPAYLVAYWRRKKNVPKHSLPKFSEKEIKDLWERFGDDDKCGLELSISKAAFYNWRRRYGIKGKPAFLKLEQLELNFPGLKLHPSAPSLTNKQTITQKTIAKSAGREKVAVGDFVEIEPDMVTSHINTLDIVQKFKELDTELVWNPNKIFIALANCSFKPKIKQAEIHKKLREFIGRQGIKNFYEISEGFCHQIAVESGLILPGQLIISADKYASSYGCLNSLAFEATDEDIATIWSKGTIKVKVPKTIRVDITGRRPHSVFGKDIALLVIKQLLNINIEGSVIEFYGNVISHMSTSERFTLTNLMMDIGAKSAICPFDSVTRRYLNGRSIASYRPTIADKNAEYAEIYQINIDHLNPQLAPIKKLNHIKPVKENEGLPINLILLGTESNGRFDDLRVAAEILKGKRINPECHLLVFPGSRNIYLEALKKGIIRVLIEAGAAVIYPGYGFCLGVENLLLTDGEKALTTTNNYISDWVDFEKSDTFLCSPATAAASALNAAITDPTRFVK